MLKNIKKNIIESLYLQKVVRDISKNFRQFVDVGISET